MRYRRYTVNYLQCIRYHPRDIPHLTLLVPTPEITTLLPSALENHNHTSHSDPSQENLNHTNLLITHLNTSVLPSHHIHVGGLDMDLG